MRGMSTQSKKQPLVVCWRLALRDDDRPSRAAKLLGFVRTYTDNRSGSTYAGLSTLARNCGYDRGAQSGHAPNLRAWAISRSIIGLG
jgi:hypothetical protein